MSQCAWDIYAEQLTPLGYGHPLWIPEPSDNGREVLIGDVGWLKEGQFRPLFSSMESADSEINQRLKGVPLHFKKFDPRNVSIANVAKITANVVYSRSVQCAEVEMGAGTSAVAPASVGAGFKFKSSTDAGAFVLLQPPGQAKDIESKRHIVNYMRENFEHWLEFANGDWGLDLKEQDIVFVCGTTKTTRWAVAAYHGNFKNKEGYVSGNFGPFASATFSVTMSDRNIPAPHSRHGPLANYAFSNVPRLMNQPAPPPPDALAAENQCLFIHYYKMKRRLFWWPGAIRAAAGPHQLPPGERDAEMPPMLPAGNALGDLEPELVTQAGDAYDPVNDLLDYILLRSEAEIAIASDLDLTAIFVERDFPASIMNALQELSPQIEVDERGVGTIVAENQFRRKRDNEDDIEQSMLASTFKRPRATPEPTSSYLPDRFGDVVQERDNSPEFTNIGVPPSVPASSMHYSSYPPAGTGHAQDDEDTPMHLPGSRSEEKRPEFGGATTHHEGSVTSLAYSQDGQFAASGSEDTSIILWDAHVTTFRQKLMGHEDTIVALAFSKDNSVLASASQDEVLLLWTIANDTTQNRPLHPDPPAAIHSLVYTPDGSMLIGGASDGKLYIWETNEYNQISVLDKNKAVVTFINFALERSEGYERYLMVTGGTENMCYVWDLRTLLDGEPLSTLSGHRGMVCAASFSADGRRIVTASDDGSSRIWNAITGELHVDLHEHTGPVWTAAMSPDGKLVATGSSDSTVKICDSYTGDRTHSLDGHDSMINAVEFSRDGLWLASSASDNTVRLWSTKDWTCHRTYNEHNDNVTFVKFSPDSLTLASGSHDGTVFIRRLDTPGLSVDSEE